MSRWSRSEATGEQLAALDAEFNAVSALQAIESRRSESATAELQRQERMRSRTGADSLAVKLSQFRALASDELCARIGARFRGARDVAIDKPFARIVEVGGVQVGPATAVLALFDAKDVDEGVEWPRVEIYSSGMVRFYSAHWPPRMPSGALKAAKIEHWPRGRDEADAAPGIGESDGRIIEAKQHSEARGDA